MSALLVNMTRRTESGAYIARVTERDAIHVRFRVENRGERAFLAKLFVRYNHGKFFFMEIYYLNFVVINEN